MANDLRIKLKIDSDTKELIVTQQGVKKLGNSLNTASGKAKTFTQSMVGIAKASVLLYGVKQGFDAIIGTLTSFTNTAANFESFEATLSTIQGSSEKAKESMSWITKFAANTPYEIDQVTESFVKMMAYGLEPTDGTLKTLGDTASAMNKPILQAVEAMADAITGENERLKEFGIKASVQGNKVAYNWRDASGKAKHIIIENNSEIIQSTLSAIFNSKYEGAMQQQMKTYKGMLSNISDQWTQFKKNFMDAGLFSWIKAFIKTINDKFQESFNNAERASSSFTANILDGFNSLIDGAGFVYRAFKGFKIIFNVITIAFKSVVAGILTGMSLVNKSINGIIEAYNSIASTVGLDIDYKLYDFASELTAMKESIKEDITDITGAWDDAVSNPQKIENFKQTLFNNFKDIQFEVNKISSSTKPEVPGAKDGNNQLGSGGGTSQTNAEKAAIKAAAEKEKTLSQFHESFMKIQSSETAFAQYQLTEQYNSYDKYVTDKDSLNKWFDSENQKLIEGRSEQEKTWVDGAKDSFKTYVKEAGNAYGQANTLFGNAMKGMEDFLVDFITTGKANFSDFINSIASDFTRMMIQKNITTPLATAASSFDWGGLLSSLNPFANGGVMTSAGPVPLRAYASGGIASTPQMALYGEGSKPEAFVPLEDGRTIPVTVSGGSSSSGSVELHLHNESGSALDFSKIQEFTKTNERGEVTKVVKAWLKGYKNNVLGLQTAVSGGRQ